MDLETKCSHFFIHGRQEMCIVVPNSLLYGTCDNPECEATIKIDMDVYKIQGTVKRRVYDYSEIKAEKKLLSVWRYVRGSGL